MLGAEDGIVQLLPGPAVFAALGRVICGANLWETVSSPSREGDVSIVWEVKFEVTDSYSSGMTCPLCEGYVLTLTCH